MNTILLVREYFKPGPDVSLLARRDHLRFLTASSGSEAIDLIAEHPELDLILVDSNLKDTDGYQLTSHIRQINAEIPIILINNYSTLESLRLAVLVKCTELIKSPVPPEELEAIVNRYLKYDNSTNNFKETEKTISW